MLIQFTFENYKCFQYETTLDMQAATITELEETVLGDPKDGERFIPVASIYGPNGSGKSTVLEALWHLTSKIMYPVVMFEDNNEKKELSQNQIVPFMLDDESREAPTSFNAIFRQSNIEFNYYISYHNNEIVNESLYKINVGGKRNIEVFFRSNNEISNGNLLKSVSKTEISSKIPYLSFLKINYNISIINTVVDWFSKCEYSHYGEYKEDRQVMFPVQKKVKDVIISALNEMDIDINDIVIKKDEKGRVEDIITIRKRDNKK